MVLTTNSVIETMTTEIHVDLQRAIADLHAAQHAGNAAADELAWANEALNAAEDADRAAHTRLREAQAALLLAVYQADV
jgi:hypothetical protein